MEPVVSPGLADPLFLFLFSEPLIHAAVYGNRFIKQVWSAAHSITSIWFLVIPDRQLSNLRTNQTPAVLRGLIRRPRNLPERLAPAFHSRLHSQRTKGFDQMKISTSFSTATSEVPDWLWYGSSPGQGITTTTTRKLIKVTDRAKYFTAG